jgi:hypothetical protein
VRLGVEDPLVEVDDVGVAKNEIKVLQSLGQKERLLLEGAQPAHDVKPLSKQNIFFGYSVDRFAFVYFGYFVRRCFMQQRMFSPKQ